MTADGAHNGDFDLHGAFAAQHAGKHRHALLSEGIGVVSPSTALL